MSSNSPLVEMQTTARRRAAAIPFAISLPLLIGIGALLQRAGGIQLATIALFALTYTVLRLSRQQSARINAHWMTRELDRRRPDLEDSADLFFRDPGSLSAVARLQSARMHSRLALGPRMDLRAKWPARVIALCWIAGIVMLGAAQHLPLLHVSTTGLSAAIDSQAEARPPGPLSPRMTLTITPPAYTQLPAQTQHEWGANVPDGSQLDWRVGFDEPYSHDNTSVDVGSLTSTEASAETRPRSAQLKFHDVDAVALKYEQNQWVGQRRLTRSTLYRLQFDDAATPAQQTPLARLNVIPDKAPQLRVSAPARSLELATPGQRTWELNFDASDDYGLGAASLLIRHAKGSGESISVTESRITLQGQGDARSRRYRRSLDLGALNFTEGDDLIVRFSVSDRKQPLAQITQSSSFILRWPDAPSTESAGIEGIVEKVLPAYFRSQRQIIIDSEALLAEKSRLAKDPFVARSDLIGVDQRLLRMRYGQFLGEESEVADAPHDHAEGEAHAEGAAHSDEAPPATTQNSGSFGESASVIEAYGHTHDDAEAATLLDPQTRALLKSALDEMWQAELHLRQGDPASALPFEYRALRKIKQVQQASRIYLARVGLELPPVDESRRLSGDRAGLRDLAALGLSAPATENRAADLWNALAGKTGDPKDDETLKAAYEAFDLWLREHPDELPNALDLMLSLDEARGAPACVECADRLRQQLWTSLPHPAPTTTARAAADATGASYLRALNTDAPP